MNILLLLLAIVAAGVTYVVTRLYYQKEVAKLQTQLQMEQRHSREMQAQHQRDSERQTQALRTEFKAMAAEALHNQSHALREQHLHSLEDLLKPLGKDIEQFRTQFVAGHSSLDRYISDLIKQTQSLGREAEDLAKALKGNNKLQGNWGEAVLTNLLDTTGLTEGRDYTLQHHLGDGKGGTAIPDVIVHLPGGRNVVIDSKVSLTAFTDYVASDNAEEQKTLLRNHVQSVRQHIKELSAKQYDKLVEGSIGYVLMFIPGEAAYMAAVTAEPGLSTEAYRQRVILINPTNLLMALQLAYNLWQSELQSRSVKEIYTSAEKLYKKFVSFGQNFVKLGRSIDQLQRTYEDAHKQLATGRGNIVSQLEGWRKKGLTPAGHLPDELTQAADDTDEVDLKTDRIDADSAVAGMELLVDDNL